MSYEASLAKLPSPLKELVANVQGDTGKTDADKAEVVCFIDRVSEGNITKAENLQELETLLTPRTYVVSNYFTAADVALYGALHPTVSQLQPPQYYATPAITRYFDHIQSKPAVLSAAQALSPAFSFVKFDLESTPKIERKAEPPKRKEKAPKQVEQQTEEKDNVTKNEAAKPNNKDEKAQKDKKEKKEKSKDAAAAEGGKKKGGAAGPAKPAEDDGEPLPSMIDMRVGHILDVKKHPDADSLYIEQIDLGEETGPRTVVSGLVNYIPIEEMRDKYLVAICNLKPANMRGVKSFAMVLAATSKDGKEGGVELIQPPPGAKPGDRVYFEGPQYENAQPLSQLNPKKKIFETIQPGFTTLETREAAWVNPVTKSVHRIRTKDADIFMALRATLASAARQFSSTARACGHTSNIGKTPIPIPSNVTVTPSQASLAVQGPLGSTSVRLESYMRLSFPQPNVLTIAVENAEEKKQRAMWGLTRTLINNAVVGMTEGFTLPIYLVGVGYRAALEEDPRGTMDGGSGQRLSMKLGHSHNVYVPIPPHIKAEVPSPTKIVLHCTDKHLLGLFAARIRKWRPPEPYKGKGVFVGNETIRLKAVKKK
ncbi:hypothetical protein ID866_8838 [Astraeus odoratus]|nr:hypothetical protein ID866_8838 [Astraeus odoratus]